MSTGEEYASVSKEDINSIYKDRGMASPSSLNNISNEEFNVTPWEVAGEVDYIKLIEKFGTFSIDESIIEKIKNITGEIHPFLKNKFFFSHRDLDWILREYE